MPFLYQNNKVVTLEDLKKDRHFGCLKCKYEKVCHYCGLDWRNISKKEAMKVINSLDKESPTHFDDFVSKLFSYDIPEDIKEKIKRDAEDLIKKEKRQ